MTSNSVNVTETNNTVTVNEETNSVTVQQGGTSTVEVVTEGPQGAQGLPGAGFDFDGSAKIDKSVVYYDSTSAKFKAVTTQTILTLGDGGNF